MKDDACPISIPRIGAIGSCRVHTPMLHAESEGLLTYARHAGFGYVHNPYEVEQIIQLSTGAAPRPPRELSTLMSVQRWRMLTPASFAETCGGGEALVIELSSVRVLRYRGKYLQIHRFREFLKGFGTTVVNAGFFDNPEAARETLMETAEKMPDDWTRNVVTELEFWEMTEDEIQASMQRIHDATTQPLTFVNIVTTANGKTGIRQREMLRDAMAAFVARHERAQLVDPTAWVVEAGIGDTMQDSSHYKPHYEPVVGRRLAEAVTGSIRN